MTREEVALLIRARKINNSTNLPRFANVTTICNTAGISRKTGYQWADEMERQIVERQIKAYDLEDSKDLNERLIGVKTGKGRKLSAKLKLRLYQEFIQSSNKSELARKWGVDRSYMYEIARECEQTIVDSFTGRRPGPNPKGKPATLEEAWDRIQVLEGKCEWETIKFENSKKKKWLISYIPNRDREILEQWRKSNDRCQWQKAVVIFESMNLDLEELSSKIECPIKRIKQWIKSFNQFGLDGLVDKRRNRDVSKFIERSKIRANRIIEIIHQNPKAFGINRSNWNQASLAAVYEKDYGERLSRNTIGKLIKRAGYGMKRARTVLTSPDPDYKEKVELLLSTLWSLKTDEMFFFIDELGPLRVKKYGGRCYVKKGETSTIPQKQISKGSITLYGALSATTNQVSWFYGKSKDTSSMIDLIEILFNQYHDKSKLYVTWDAASWHRSSELTNWLDTFNDQTNRIGTGPIINLVPLPSSSQFLDVIEAVFSAMKKAVIHHSNYQSEEEMKNAISLHFKERNDYFKENPKRAGKKIWEVDFFRDYNNLKAGNYREW